MGARPAIHPGQTAGSETRAAFGRRSIPAEPRRCAPLIVAFRSKYTRYSSLTRLVSRAPHRPRRSRGFHHRLFTASLRAAHRCVSVEIHSGQFSRWGLLSHAPCQPGASPASALTWVPPQAVHRVAARRSSLRFGRNTPGPVLPVGAPPSRALSAGRLAGQFSRWGPRRSRGFHHRLLTARGESTPHEPQEVARGESVGLCACGALSPRVDGANRCAIRTIVFRGEGKPLPTPHPRGAARREWMPSGFHHRLLIGAVAEDPHRGRDRDTGNDQGTGIDRSQRARPQDRITEGSGSRA